jgi:pimeloyl-[acyl-carrier protein] methyl ester esterase
MNIHITKYGQGLPLVLFHGWGFDSSIWQPLLAPLEDIFEIILVDLPGFGLTPLMDSSQFIDELLEQLPKQSLFAGWSMGGLYATRLALKAPERVHTLINICSSPYFISDTDWPGISPEVIADFYKNISTDPRLTLSQFVALQTNGRLKNYVPAIHPSIEALKAGLTVLESWDLRKDMHKLKRSTYYIFGRLDPISSEKTMKKMQVLYPDFKYILFRKSAHMPFLSQPDEFIELLRGLIS